MSQWVKLLGSSNPPSSRVPNDWIASHRSGELMQIESGPKGSMPPFEVGDDMILVAAGWSRAFAAVELAQGPEWADAPRWGASWPWVLRVRLHAWFPRIEDAPKVTEAGVPRSYGGPYQRISPAEYEAALKAFRQRGARFAS